MDDSTRRPPSMADVAARAGVSHQTVSRALNGTGKVAPATRDRIMAVISEIGYRRNSVARALATNRSGIIGIVATTFVHYGPTSTLVSIEVAAREAGYYTGVTVLEDFSVESVAEAVDRFLGLAVEVIVVVAPTTGLPESFIGMKVPVPVPVIAVTAAELDASFGIRTVHVDQYEGARMAVRHLVGAGHRRIAHVAGPREWYEARARERGWRDELAASGFEAGQVFGFGWDARTGYEAGRELLAGDLPTAVFAANDELALGLLKAFSEAGVVVPDDVSIIGFDDEPTAEFFTPALTTIRQDFTALGRLTIEAVSSAIAGRRDTSAIVVAPVLVDRDSVVAPRRR